MCKISDLLVFFNYWWASKNDGWLGIFSGRAREARKKINAAHEKADGEWRATMSACSSPPSPHTTYRVSWHPFVTLLLFSSVPVSFQRLHPRHPLPRFPGAIITRLLCFVRSSHGNLFTFDPPSMGTVAEPFIFLRCSPSNFPRLTMRVLFFT